MNPKLLVCFKAIVWVLWPLTAVATSVTLDQTITRVSLTAWLLVFVLSGMSGLGALLNRLKDGLPPLLVLFVSSHMVCSLLAGLLGFFLAETAGIPGMAEPIVIIAFGYGGAAAIDKVVAKYVGQVTRP
jgi:hypothetical protein